MSHHMLTTYAVAPGEFLNEYIEESEDTIDNVSSHLNLSEEEVGSFIKGDISIDETLSEKLSSLTGIPARIWIGLQGVYDADKKRLNL